MQRNKNYTKFMLLWLGELISSIGGGLTSFGLGVYVFRLTGSAASMSIVTLLAFLPTVILSVPAGVLADRYDRRVLMMLGDGLSAVGVIYILLCVMSGNANMINICIGVTISSVFSALMQPAFQATITDLLTEEEYSKASGLVGITGSARYLISPVIAGILLSVSDISLLLIIDACTFFITVATTAVVKRGIARKENKEHESFMNSFKSGWRAVSDNKGVLILIIIASIICLFIGMFQILSEPIVLSFADSKTLGIAETVCASGMLVSSIMVGIIGIKKRHVTVLACSLLVAAGAIIVFGLKENIILLCVSGFVFFMMMPFANASLDFLARSNIANEYQGRAWGFIGFISQMGSAVAYAGSGLLADAAGRGFGIGVGRGSALVVIVSGILLIMVSASILFMKSVRRLEHTAEEQIAAQ